MKVFIYFFIVILTLTLPYWTYGDSFGTKGNSPLSDGDGNTFENYDVELDSRIVGGQTVDAEGGDPKRYPYQVGLFTYSKDFPLCGGSLIASNVVLSAAHCASVSKRVKIGCWDHGNADDVSGAEEFTIVAKMAHPSYKKRFPDFDIILYKLSGHSKQQPIQLVSNNTYHGLTTDTTFSVIGWGLTSAENEKSSSKLRHVEVNYVSNTVCNNKYSGYVTSNMVCAASQGKDACQGDSGGPLIIKKSSPVEDELVGCVSWGYGCADPRYPGVYCNVHAFKSWINDVACNQWGAQGRLCSTTAPTPFPTRNPTKNPSESPTGGPTLSPSESPTLSPSESPSIRLTSGPVSATKASVDKVTTSHGTANDGVNDVSINSIETPNAEIIFALTNAGCVPYLPRSRTIDGMLRQAFVDPCTDSVCFMGKKGKERTCTWTGKKQSRCRDHGLKCPETCGLCDKKT